MTMKLRYETVKRRYLILSEGQPYKSEIDGFTLSEEYEGPADSDRFGTYRLVMEAQVASQEDIWDLSEPAFRIAEDLDRCWIYGVGLPLFYPSNDLVIVHAPENWITNKTEVQAELQRQQRRPFLSGTTKITPRPGGVQLGRFPLESCIEVVNKYREADENLRSLVQLHHRAITDTSGFGELLLLAKGLELAREFVPNGRSQSEQAQNIPARDSCTTKKDRGLAL